MKYFSLLLVLASLIPAAGQKVSFQADARKINGKSADGNSVEILAPKESVNSAFAKYLKDIGKTKTSSGIISISNPLLGGTTWEKMIVYAQVTGDMNKTVTWMGLCKEEWPDRDTDAIIGQMRDLVYQFGVKYYRDQIQLEIDKTQSAVDAADKKILRLTSQGKDFAQKLVDNEAEKIKLEKALELNVSNHTLLTQKIELNKKSLDSMNNAAAQIRKVLEGQKERQQKVN